MKDTSGRDALDCLLSPQSIAIIGVSNDFNKLNGRVMKFLLDKGYTGRIFPVNPKYDEVGGHRCSPTIGDIGETPDLAVISVPAKLVPDQLIAAGEAGVRAAIVFSSGFGEMGEEGREKEREVVEIAKRYDMRLCGPNTLGIINAFDGAFATFTQYGMGKTSPGSSLRRTPTPVPAAIPGPSAWARPGTPMAPAYSPETRSPRMRRSPYSAMTLPGSRTTSSVWWPCRSTRTSSTLWSRSPTTSAPVPWSALPCCAS